MLTDDTLFAEARRLRFSEPRREARYRREHITSGLLRERSLIAVGLVSSTLTGILELRADALDPDVAWRMQFWRFTMLTPALLLVFCASFHRAFIRYGHTFNVFATILATWGLGLFAWEHQRGYPETDLSVMLLGSVNLCLMASALAIPMLFPWLVAALVSAISGLALLYHFMLPDLSVADLLRIDANLGLTLATLLAIGWFREAGDRRNFAQREYLDSLNNELARLNTERSEFLAIAAHDLRAPLANIRALAELLRDERLPEPARRRLAAKNIHDEAGRVLALVNGYLSSSEAEHGRLPVRLTRVDLRAIAAAALERHATAAADKRQNIDLAGGPLHVLADAGLLAQVADNFITNALKFSPVASTVRLVIETAADGKTARLAVHDQGPGVAPEDHPGLFRRFARLSAKPTGGESSTGLGLAVAKRLAEAMNARVGCDSTPGRGAVFRIEFSTD